VRQRATPPGGRKAAFSWRLDNFFRHGMTINVTAALGVEDLSAGSAWVAARARLRAPRRGRLLNARSG
jgi:hypothetical protein